ncbi:MAG: hypothetical protein ACFHWZ_10310 [Phycisphaerales bacterium]
MKRETPLTLWHLIAPLPATAIGAMVMRFSGISPSVWLQNLVATALALVLITPLWLRGVKKPEHPEHPLRGGRVHRPARADRDSTQR